MSESSETSVHRISVEDVPPRPRLVRPQEAGTNPIVQTPLSTLPSTAPSPAYSTLDVVVTAFTGLGYALSARGLLLLSLIFSFVLAVEAMRSQTPMALYILVAGSAFTVLPVAYLEIRRRSQ